MEITEDIDYGDSSVYRFEMANKLGNYGGTDEASLGRAGFSSKEFNAKSGKLEDAAQAPAPVPAAVTASEEDYYGNGDVDSYGTDSYGGEGDGEESYD